MKETNDTATRILEQAHTLFMQYGLKSVSMDDIASKMGISKKTIYQFYSDKDQLVESVVSKTIAENQQQCDIDTKISKDAVHEIFLAMEMMMNMFQSMNPSLLFDMHKYYPGAFKIFLSHKNEYLYGVIKNNLIRGIEEELYRNDLNIEVITRLRIETIVLPFNPEFQLKIKNNLVEISEEITTHFLFGLVTQKGYKLTLKYLQNKK